MGTSAGFLEIGLSGKMRIQTRPPRLMWRVIARRAASIWRAVRRPRAMAFRPNSPNETLAPRVATPLLRPFCSLRYFLLAGCSISHPGFAAAGFAFTVGTLRLGRRGRGLLALGQHGAVEPPRARDLDALGAQAHGVLHRALHGAAEHDALLELARDRVGDELGVELGLADLLDVHVHGHAHQLL